MSELNNAINSNNINKVKSIINNKESDINELDNFGNTPLILAIFKKQTDIAKLLINNNANTEIKNKHGQTALFFSVLTNSTEIFNLLINTENPDFNIKDEFGRTLFSLAQKNKNKHILETLELHSKANKPIGKVILRPKINFNTSEESKPLSVSPISGTTFLSLKKENLNIKSNEKIIKTETQVNNEINEVNHINIQNTIENNDVIGSINNDNNFHSISINTINELTSEQNLVKNESGIITNNLYEVKAQIGKIDDIIITETPKVDSQNLIHSNELSDSHNNSFINEANISSSNNNSQIFDQFINIEKTNINNFSFDKPEVSNNIINENNFHTIPPSNINKSYDNQILDNKESIEIINNPNETKIQFDTKDNIIIADPLKSDVQNLADSNILQEANDPCSINSQNLIQSKSENHFLETHKDDQEANRIVSNIVVNNSIDEEKTLSPYKFNNIYYNKIKDIFDTLITKPNLWNEFKIHLEKGYFIKWLESNNEYDFAAKIEKYKNEAKNDLNIWFYKIIYNYNNKLNFFYNEIEIDENFFDLLFQKINGADFNSFQNDNLIQCIIKGDFLSCFNEYISITSKYKDQFLYSSIHLLLFCASTAYNNHFNNTSDLFTAYEEFKNTLNLLLDHNKYVIPEDMKGYDLALFIMSNRNSLISKDDYNKIITEHNDIPDEIKNGLLKPATYLNSYNYISQNYIIIPVTTTIIDELCVSNNQNYIMRDNVYQINKGIFVEEGGKLTIENSELIIGKNVIILSLGILNLLNSSFKSIDNEVQWCGVAFRGNFIDKCTIDNCYFYDARGFFENKENENIAPIYINGMTNLNKNSTFKISNSTFIGLGMPLLEMDGLGGAIACLNMNLVLENCTFEICHNQAGGALFSDHSNITINSCKFSGHFSKTGGALCTNHSILEIKDCSFDNCLSFSEGGALYLINTELKIANSKFNKCNSQSGGSILATNSDMQISNCKFINCIAQKNGGAIMTNCKLLVDKCSFINCNAAEAGGGLLFYTSKDDSKIEYSVFKNCISNTAGGIGTFDSQNILIQNCSFDHCLGSFNHFDGIFSRNTLNLKIKNCTVERDKTLVKFNEIFLWCAIPIILLFLIFTGFELTFCIVIFLLIIFATAHNVITQKILNSCPNCHAWDTAILCKAEELERKDGYATVQRVDNVSVYNNQDSEYYNGQISRQEQIHVTDIKNRDHFKCSNCNFEWTSISFKRVEY